MINFTRGMLVEYGLSIPPLALEFEFNPETLTRNRTVTVSNSQTCMDFKTPQESRRVAQSVKAGAETLSFKIMIDATDSIADSNDPRHAIAKVYGIEPELSTLRTMLEPKVNGPGGFQLMAGLNMGKQRAHDRDTHLSVLLFVWGTHVFPVFMTSLSIDEKAYLPDLIPYRADVTLGLQVIESSNPFYQVELGRQMNTASLNLVNQAISF